MKISELRAIGARRTPGKWEYTEDEGIYSAEVNNYPVEPHSLNKCDGDFICASSAAWEKLLRCAEAAIVVVDRYGIDDILATDSAVYELRAALAALEK